MISMMIVGRFEIKIVMITRIYIFLVIIILRERDLRQGNKAIKLFTVVIYECSQFARLFVLGRLL
jgi:hypothetical protein